MYAVVILSYKPFHSFTFLVAYRKAIEYYYSLCVSVLICSRRYKLSFYLKKGFCKPEGFLENLLSIETLFERLKFLLLLEITCFIFFPHCFILFYFLHAFGA